MTRSMRCCWASASSSSRTDWSPPAAIREDVAARPRTPYVAELMGRNLWRGRADGVTVVVDGGGVLQVADSADGPVLVSAPPSALALHRRRPSGSARNVWRGRVTALETVGERVRVRLEGEPHAVAEVTPRAVADLGIGEGATVWISLKATELDVYSCVKADRMNVTVLGGGSWGTTVASLSAARNPTILWARNAEVAQQIDEEHVNESYLPGSSSTTTCEAPPTSKRR